MRGAGAGLTLLFRDSRRVIIDHTAVTRPPGGAGAWLDEACLQGEPGQVGAAPAPALVTDPVQVGADGTDADVQLPGDLGVGTALGDQGDQLLLPGAELRLAWRCLWYLASLGW